MLTLTCDRARPGSGDHEFEGAVCRRPAAELGRGQGAGPRGLVFQSRLGGGSVSWDLWRVMAVGEVSKRGGGRGSGEPLRRNRRDLAMRRSGLPLAGMPGKPPCQSFNQTKGHHNLPSLGDANVSELRSVLNTFFPSFYLKRNR